MGKFYIFSFAALKFLIIYISKSDAYPVTFHNKQNFLDKVSKFIRSMWFFKIMLEIFFNIKISLIYFIFVYILIDWFVVKKYLLNCTQMHTVIHANNSDLLLPFNHNVCVLGRKKGRNDLKCVIFYIQNTLLHSLISGIFNF